MFKLPNFDSMYRDMAAGLPNVVYCLECGREQPVDPAACLRRGWPSCCGKTMSLNTPGAVAAQRKD